MRLSVDRINAKSPYWVVQLSDMQFRFATRNGVRYRIGFFADEYFLGDKAYHFFIDNEEDLFAPKDPDVYNVIKLVIEEFFRQDASVMLYICDGEDHRERIRSELYKRWFESYKQNSRLTLKTEELNIDGYLVYTGMILRKDHPEYDKMLTDYQDFVKRAESLYRAQRK